MCEKVRHLATFVRIQLSNHFPFQQTSLPTMPSPGRHSRACEPPWTRHSRPHVWWQAVVAISFFFELFSHHFAVLFSPCLTHLCLVMKTVTRTAATSAPAAVAAATTPLRNEDSNEVYPTATRRRQVRNNGKTTTGRSNNKQDDECGNNEENDSHMLTTSPATRGTTAPTVWPHMQAPLGIFFFPFFFRLSFFVD
jgi:hypothetical protein